MHDVQPGAVVVKKTAFGHPDVITHVIYQKPETPDQIFFRSGEVWIFSRHTELEFLGNLRHDRGEIELGPQVEYGEPRKVTSYSKEELQRIVSLPPAPVQEPEED